MRYAFIFARGGSKGLPGKNIKHLAGKPLIAYSIEVAHETGVFNKVFVSTDSDEIAQVAVEAGAEVIARPMALSGDKSPEWLAWRHAIEWVEDKYGIFDEFVSLPATSPLRSVVDVQAAIEKRAVTGADICISITEASRSPYFNMVTADINGYVELALRSEGVINRRQDVPEVFDITTVVYATTVKFVKEKNGLFEGAVVSVKIPKERAVDIDDIYDFNLAEVILQKKLNNDA